jgi:recombination protein RecT
VLFRSNAYIQSVLIACAASKDLMACEPESVLRSALRAASLELSCDPALKQAYLVPIKGKAEFWPHYRGLYTLAMRTGKYVAINVTPVYEGQRVVMNNVTGIHNLVIRGDLMVDNDRLSKLFAQGYSDVTDGKPKEKVVGYLGYFQTVRGFKKTVYMSLSDIVEHVEKYAPGNYHNPKSDWNDPKFRPAMEAKTVLKELLRWADLSGKESAGLRQAMAADIDQPEMASDDEILEAVAGDALAKEKKTEAGVLKDLGYEDPEKIPDREWDSWLQLCQRAEKVNVPYDAAARDMWKLSDLRTAYADLLDGVKNAEAQAKE